MDTDFFRVHCNFIGHTKTDFQRRPSTAAVPVFTF
jgi:hypothetical protein